jgi:hypothetical protein
MTQGKVGELDSQQPFPRPNPKVSLVGNQLERGHAPKSRNLSEPSERTIFQNGEAFQRADPKSILFVEVQSKNGGGGETIFLRQERGGSIWRENPETSPLKSKPKCAIDRLCHAAHRIEPIKNGWDAGIRGEGAFGEKFEEAIYTTGPQLVFCVSVKAQNHAARATFFVGRRLRFDRIVSNMKQVIASGSNPEGVVRPFDYRRNTALDVSDFERRPVGDVVDHSGFRPSQDTSGACCCHDTESRFRFGWWEICGDFPLKPK